MPMARTQYTATMATPVPSASLKFIRAAPVGCHLRQPHHTSGDAVYGLLRVLVVRTIRPAVISTRLLSRSFNKSAGRMKNEVERIGIQTQVLAKSNRKPQLPCPNSPAFPDLQPSIPEWAEDSLSH